MSLNVWIVNGEAKQYFALNSNFLHYKVKNGITRKILYLEQITNQLFICRHYQFDNDMGI